MTNAKMNAGTRRATAARTERALFGIGMCPNLPTTPPPNVPSPHLPTRLRPGHRRPRPLGHRANPQRLRPYPPTRFTAASTPTANAAPPVSTAPCSKNRSRSLPPNPVVARWKSASPAACTTAERPRLPAPPPPPPPPSPVSPRTECTAAPNASTCSDTWASCPYPLTVSPSGPFWRT